jgi:hypothetical protein
MNTNERFNYAAILQGDAEKCFDYRLLALTNAATELTAPGLVKALNHILHNETSMPRLQTVMFQLEKLGDQYEKIAPVVMEASIYMLHPAQVFEQKSASVLRYSALRNIGELGLKYAALRDDSHAFMLRAAEQDEAPAVLWTAAKWLGVYHLETALNDHQRRAGMTALEILVFHESELVRIRAQEYLHKIRQAENQTSTLAPQPQ